MKTPYHKRANDGVMAIVSPWAEETAKVSKRRVKEGLQESRPGMTKARRARMLRVAKYWHRARFGKDAGGCPGAR